MSLFNFRKRNDSEQNALKSNELPIDARPEIKESDFIDLSDPNEEVQPDLPEKHSDENDVVVISYGTGFPIDAVYAYIEKDWEAIGRQDAMENTDANCMEGKMEIIRQGLIRRFDLIKLKYNAMIRDQQSRLDNLKTFGLLGSMTQLMAQIDTCKEHLEKIKDLEQKLKEGDPSLTSMIDSYKRGFTMGVALETKKIINNNM